MIFSHLPAGYITAIVAKKASKTKFNKKQTFWIILISMVAAIFPDIDILYHYIINAELSHREILTHTPFLYLVICSIILLIGFLKNNTLWKFLSLVVFSSAIVHLILDSTTAGIPWLYPYSNRLYGLLSIDILNNGFYGNNIFVFTLSLELLIFLLFFIFIIYIKTNKFKFRLYAVVFSIVCLISWTTILFNINNHMHSRNSLIYYGDIDNDKIINMRDADIDGDGIDNIYDSDADNNGNINKIDLIAAINKLKNIWYDPTEKGYWEILSRFGFLTNNDIVLKSYDSIGIFLGAEMKNNFKENPKNYIGNPQNNLFQNEAQNLYNFCKNKNFILDQNEKPEIGDIIFYGNAEEIKYVSLISRIKDDNIYVIFGKSGLKTIEEYNYLEILKLDLKVIAYGRILQ